MIIQNIIVIKYIVQCKWYAMLCYAMIFNDELHFYNCALQQVCH